MNRYFFSLSAVVMLYCFRFVPAEIATMWRVTIATIQEDADRKTQELAILHRPSSIFA